MKFVRWHFLLLVPLSIFSVFVLCLSLFGLYVVRENSMAPGFVNGQVAVVFKGAYFFTPPRRGDIVVFSIPKDDRLAIKRCAFTSGETLLITEEGIKFEDKIFHLTKTQYETLNRNPIVPQNSVFMLGDNELLSEDSRRYGSIAENRIRGKVITFGKRRNS